MVNTSTFRFNPVLSIKELFGVPQLLANASVYMEDRALKHNAAQATAF